jgi:hypothetical protein
MKLTLGEKEFSSARYSEVNFVSWLVSVYDSAEYTHTIIERPAASWASTTTRLNMVEQAWRADREEQKAEARGERREHALRYARQRPLGDGPRTSGGLGRRRRPRQERPFRVRRSSVPWLQLVKSSLDHSVSQRPRHQSRD